MSADDEATRYATDLQPLYRLYATKVQELILSILRQQGITPHSVTYREKSLSSLREKINRGGKAYENPLDQITDLAGVRVITYFLTDVDKIVPLIENQFVIDKGNSVDKRQSADSSAFGYASVHLVVQLTADRCNLPEYSVFKDLKCEIQVRTILQHAWAEIEHDIVYKSNADIPSELRRKFASLAGLLEVADREFEMLRRDEAHIREHIRRTITHDNLKMLINLDSLRFYLERYHNELVSGVDYRGKLSELVQFLSKVGIETLSQLHEVLSPAALDAAQKRLAGTPINCSSTKDCMLPIFLAVGQYFNMPLEEIGRALPCPVLMGGGRSGHVIRSGGPGGVRSATKEGSQPRKRE